MQLIIQYIVILHLYSFRKSRFNEFSEPGNIINFIERVLVDEIARKSRRNQQAEASEILKRKM